jgi:hypothetical protein
MKIADLRLEDEIPLRELPNPDMSENYAWCGFDKDSGVGFFCHLGRWSQDRTLWREQLYLYLPDKTVLAYRGYGHNCHNNGPAAGIQKQTCLEPGRRWRLEHKGPTARYFPHELTRGPATEPFVSKVDFEVEFSGDLVPFMYPGSENTTWGHWHYEQVGSVQGRIIYEGNTYPLNGFGFRDHTRGPRDLKHFCGSNWIQGRLPDGVGFALFQTWDRVEGKITPGLCELTLSTEDGLEKAEILDYPAFDSMDDLNEPIAISFACSRGRVDIKGEPQNTMIFSASARHEILLGAARDKAPLLVAEQPMILRVGDETGVGHCERCRVVIGDKPGLRWRS